MKAFGRAVDLRERLLTLLEPEGQTELDAWMDSMMEALVAAERNAFVLGFGLGAQMLAEGLGTTSNRCP